jgi:hypothetical protein
MSRAVPLDIPDALPVDSVPVAPDEPPPTLRRNTQRYRKLDPSTCWNHDYESAAGLCADCRVPFCSACLVEYRGHFICGVCKNFRIAGAGQPIRTYPMALVALISALVVGPVALILSLVAIGLYLSDGTAGPTVLLSVVALLPVAGVLTLSLWVLRRLEGQTRLSGRALAMSGTCVALSTLLWCITVLGFVALRSAGG